MSSLRPKTPLRLPPSSRADFDRAPGPSSAGRADARALDRIGLETALSQRVLPMERAGWVTPVACTDIDVFTRLEPGLTARLGPVVFRRKAERDILAEIERLRAPYLARRAETRTPARESCRGWSGARTGAIAVLVASLGLAVTLAWPRAAVLALAAWTALTLVSVTLLRSLGALVEFRHARRMARTWTSRRPDPPLGPLPRISLLVPLYRETEIASRLVERLGRLAYPRHRMEVCLILEASDTATADALDAASLPPFMRVVRVPDGACRTKPRAMNYAFDFTQGDIVGIYDAEDRPARDQLLKIAQAFSRAGPEVACLQGVLDFYNPRQSWLTRCFTIDYAAWFRLVLPGLVRLGFVIPLGGTTVFFRRAALESLGRWDAQNVTEDADLGLRLARHGFRCAFVPTVTEEEATASVPAWIRQRSRWIKGYWVTWAVHMRDPLRLLGDLGPLRFIGVQILFLGTLSQFVLAPVLWSFWLIVFGLPHPLTHVAPPGVVPALAALFFFCEVATMAILAASVATPRGSWLIKWVPLMHLYFPLAALASWKGMAELVTRPFYWDKTQHGLTVNRSRPASQAHL
ncbi:glycosyltransferase [Silicimonas algicola]|uniref:glycosyltransferase n=1 Tax=Silicimonas algicola TaxID=1826607 RepID=UPI001F492F14|nr:glycosyltransferase [Silicimonas algicola]